MWPLLLARCKGPPQAACAGVPAGSECGVRQCSRLHASPVKEVESVIPPELAATILRLYEVEKWRVGTIAYQL